MVFAPTIFQCICFSINSPAEPIVKQQLLPGGIFSEFGGRGSRAVRDGEERIKDRKEIRIRKRDPNQKKAAIQSEGIKTDRPLDNSRFQQVERQ